MKKISLFLLAGLVLALLSSCTTVEPLTLVPSSDSKVQNFIQGGSAFSASMDHDVQMIIGTDSYSSNKVGFIVSIKDTNNDSFAFRDDYISLYGGNKDTNTWKLLGKWDSRKFIQSQNNKAKTALAATGIIATMAMLDIIFNDNTSSDAVFDFAIDALIMHSIFDEVNASVSVSTTSPAAVATLASIETAIAMDQLTDMYQAETSGEIIQVPNKTNLTSVSGKIVFDDIAKYPDYKVVFNNGKQKMSYVFSRSDREEIIHPWRDKKTTVLAFNYNYTHGLGRHNITVNVLQPSLFGFNAGLSFSKDSLGRNRVGASLGGNFKIADNSWLSSSLEICDLSFPSSQIDLLGSVGINVALNMISLYGGCVYQDGKFYFEGGAGVAL